LNQIIAVMEHDMALLRVALIHAQTQLLLACDVPTHDLGPFCQRQTDWNGVYAGFTSSAARIL